MIWHRLIYLTTMGFGLLLGAYYLACSYPQIFNNLMVPVIAFGVLFLLIVFRPDGGR